MITTKLIFDRKKQASRQQPGTIEIRITADRHSYYITTGLRVLRSEFVAGQICNRPDADVLNERLLIVYKKTNEAINDCIKRGHFTIDYVRKRVNLGVDDAVSETTFLDWIEKQISMLNIVEGTRKHYRTLHTRLTEWGGMKTWDDVTVENIFNFDAWLHTLTKPISDEQLKAGAKPEKIGDGAVYNYHKCLKHLLKRADMFGKIERNPYEKLRGQFNRGDKENVEFLTESEMLKLEQMELQAGSALDVSRDLFVFQMYTGLAYSDSQAFDIKQYKHENGKWIHVGERIKTGVPYVSNLLPPVVKVLEKYGWRVPQIENHVYNRHLKALGAMAGIQTPLHSHLARHTFATYMLSNDVRFQNVGKMLGQKNLTQTQRYAKVLAQSVHDDFEMIAEKLKKR